MFDLLSPNYRWEYSRLARMGNVLWCHAIDPVLRLFSGDDLTFLRKMRGVIQLTLTIAIAMLLLSPFHNTTRLLTISGLLFDIAWALRLFLFEEIDSALSGFTPNEHGDVPSVAMRELIMPEASGPHDADSDHMSLFYYRKRGVLFLVIGFFLQLIGSIG